MGDTCILTQWISSSLKHLPGTKTTTTTTKQNKKQNKTKKKTPSASFFPNNRNTPQVTLQALNLTHPTYASLNTHKMYMLFLHACMHTLPGIEIYPNLCWFYYIKISQVD